MNFFKLKHRNHVNNMQTQKLVNHFKLEQPKSTKTSNSLSSKFMKKMTDSRMNVCNLNEKKG